MELFKDRWRGVCEVPTSRLEVEEKNRRGEQLLFPARSMVRSRANMPFQFCKVCLPTVR